MKNSRSSLFIATLILAGLQTASLPRAHADELDTFAIQDTLASGPWKFTQTGLKWSSYRIFKKDGTFVSSDRPDETGHWKITGNTVVLTYGDGTQDVLMLPLNVKGTSVVNKWGTGSIARDDSPPGNTALSLISPPATESETQDKGAAMSRLTSAPWKVSGDVGGWSRVRIFDKNGLFTTQGNGDEHGRWKFFKNMIILAFNDGHKDVIALPLDPKGTRGFGSNGEPLTCTQENAPAANNAPASTPAVSGIPAITPIALQDRDAIVTLLTAGPWRIKGNNGGWTIVRVFARDGTYTTLARQDLHGHWRISGDKIIVTSSDGHKDSMTLPLNAKGTPGVAEGGEPMTCTLVTPSAP